jgi:hypothetical protein
LVEHECPRCHKAVELPLGELCPACRAEITRRARRWARWTALGSTALLMAYIITRKPAGPNGQLVAVVSTAVWYFMSYRVAERVAREIVS